MIKESLQEHLRSLKAEVGPSTTPDWYNGHDYASGHWAGRTAMLNREIGWLETILAMDEKSG